MKEGKSCHTCGKVSFNLMNAICGHKICFTCVKLNKNTYKCSNCANQPKHNNMSASPTRNVSHDRQKQRSTKVKDSDVKGYLQSSPLNNMRSSRKTPHKQSTNIMFETPSVPYNQYDPQTSIHLICKDHHQPLTMFCKSSKELICTVCLCQKRYNHDIMPLKGAEEYLRKQNKIQREDSRFILNNVQNAEKVMRKNLDVFQQLYSNHKFIIDNVFNNIYQEIRLLEQQSKNILDDFFHKKFEECSQILEDLNCLSKILKDYRQSNKENSSLSELVYVFTSFKVIKSTTKNLDFDYLAYTKDIKLMQVNKHALIHMIQDLIKFNLELPLKYHQKRKNKSISNKSASKSKYEDSLLMDEAKQGYTVITHNKSHKEQFKGVNKKHQMSLCGNIHGMEMGEDQKNLYKILLKSKFRV